MFLWVYVKGLKYFKQQTWAYIQNVKEKWRSVYIFVHFFLSADVRIKLLDVFSSFF